jgi:hypothetical protein
MLEDVWLEKATRKRLTARLCRYLWHCLDYQLLYCGFVRPSLPRTGNRIAGFIVYVSGFLAFLLLLKALIRSTHCLLVNLIPGCLYLSVAFYQFDFVAVQVMMAVSVAFDVFFGYIPSVFKISISYIPVDVDWLIER